MEKFVVIELARKIVWFAFVLMTAPLIVSHCVVIYTNATLVGTIYYTFQPKRLKN